MPNFATLSNGGVNTHMRKHTHKLQTGPAVEMANPGLWFYWLTLGGPNKDIHHVPHFLFRFLPFRDTARDVLLNCRISAVLTSPFRSRGNSCTSRFIGEKKQSRLIAGLRRRQTVQSTAPGSQCYAQNWVSLSWLSCSREHTQGEVSECFSQAAHLSGNTDFHFNTFEEVDNGFKINAFIYNEHKMQNVLCTSKCLCETVSIKKNMLYIRGWITVLLHVIIHKK